MNVVFLRTLIKRLSPIVLHDFHTLSILYAKIRLFMSSEGTMAFADGQLGICR
jgi:hypothetical protein